MKKLHKLSTAKPSLSITVAPNRLSVATTKSRESWRSWYNGKLWKQLRRQQLNRKPMCEMCAAAGRITVADVVDHRVPHRGNWDLFKDPENFQSLCATHHNSTKQRMEKRDLSGPIGGDTSGMPSDPNHHWNLGA